MAHAKSAQTPMPPPGWSRCDVATNQRRTEGEKHWQSAREILPPSADLSRALYSRPRRRSLASGSCLLVSYQNTKTDSNVVVSGTPERCPWELQKAVSNKLSLMHEKHRILGRSSYFQTRTLAPGKAHEQQSVRAGIESKTAPQGRLHGVPIRSADGAVVLAVLERVVQGVAMLPDEVHARHRCQPPALCQHPPMPAHPSRPTQARAPTQPTAILPNSHTETPSHTTDTRAPGARPMPAVQWI